MPPSILSLFGSLEERADKLYRRGRLSKAAQLFRKAGRYGQAASIYVEEGNLDAAVEVYREAGQLRQAGEVLLKHARPRDAVTLFEEAGAFRQAAEACLALHQYQRAGGFYERSDLLQAAADAYAKAEDFEHALAAWARESERLRTQGDNQPGQLERLRDIDLSRAELLVRLGRGEAAAEIFLTLERPGRAAPLLARAGRLAEAARAYLDAGEIERAKAIVDGAESGAIDDELQLDIHLRSGRHAEAAEILERLGRLDEAAGAYEDALDWGKAARLWEQLDMPGRAADLYYRVERFGAAGQCFAASHQHEKAGQSFARANNHRAAADAFLAADALLRAAEHYLEVGDQAAARDALQGVTEDDPHYDRASLMLIPLLLEDGLAEGARHRLAALESSRSSGRLTGPSSHYWSGRIAEAEEQWAEAELHYQRVISERSGYRDSSQRLVAVRQRLESLDTAAIESAASQPIAVEASGARDPALDTAALASVESDGELLEQLSVAVDQALGPWWPGSALFRAKPRPDGDASLVLTFPLASGPPRERFRGLSGKVRQLTYPSILRLEEAILTDDRAVLRFEPFGGQPMSRRLRGPWRPLPRTALNILVQVGEALAAAHQLGLVHGWLSPNTILIDDDERIKLAGFGLDTLFPADDGTAMAYRAPELSAGVEAGPAADLFSVGLLGVELFGALLPVDWTEGAIDATAVEWDESVAEVVPEGVRTTLVRSLARDPLARPSAERLRGALSSLGLMPGQMIQSRYQVEEEIGRGGMSRVYRAYDRTVAERVAIKTLLSPMLRNPEEEQRLLREVQICRRITHPNVVRVHDIGHFPGGIFITMELLDGERLDRLIRARAPLPLAEVRGLLRQIAAALGEAHRMDVVHRDLKPGNVIVAGDWVKVLDFGIARMGGGSNLTRTGEVYGSPLYMAPEQIRGKPLNGTCDLYALGVIAFALLTGREPFQGDNPEDVIYQHLKEPPPDPRTLREGLPEPWAGLVERLLVKRPEDRLPDVPTLLRILDSLPDDPPANAGEAAGEGGEAAG